jgi:hypothetical protein
MLATRKLPFRVVAIDPAQPRREKMKIIYAAIDASGKGGGEFVVASIEEAKAAVSMWTKGVGCTAVLEVSIRISTNHSVNETRFDRLWETIAP